MTTTEAGPELDMGRVEEFAQQVAGLLTGGATTAMMVVGDRLGLYAALAGSGAMSPEDLAAATGTAERYVREWLSQQAAVGFVAFDPDTGTFSMSPEHAAVLATDDSPASLIGAAPMMTGMHRRVDDLVGAFRTGEGLPWGDADATVFESTARFFGAAYRAFLVPEWIPAIDGLQERLRAGAAVADVGCGYGIPDVLMAQAFPASSFVGYDVHEGSLDAARGRAASAGVSDRLRFEAGESHGYPQAGYDLVTFFDTFHDLGDPAGAAAHARGALAEDGVVMLVEPLAMDDLASTLEQVPMAALSYAASTFLCTPNSRSQPVGAALGSQAGEARLREALAAGGLTRVRRAAETPFHMVLEARP